MSMGIVPIGNPVFLGGQQQQEDQPHQDLQQGGHHQHQEQRQPVVWWSCLTEILETDLERFEVVD